MAAAVVKTKKDFTFYVCGQEKEVRNFYALISLNCMATKKEKEKSKDGIVDIKRLSFLPVIKDTDIEVVDNYVTLHIMDLLLYWILRPKKGNERKEEIL